MSKHQTFKATLKKAHTHGGKARNKGDSIELGRSTAVFLAERGIIDKPAGLDPAPTNPPKTAA